MYIKVDFVKELLDVDVIFNIENAIVDDKYFVFFFGEGFGYPKRMHSLNIGMLFYKVF